MPSGNSGGRPGGVLTGWKDDRGFGFIEPAAGGPRLFVHISAFPRGRRPINGCRVTYVETRDERNRARALDVRYLGSAPARSKGGGTGRLPEALVAVVLFFALLAGLTVLDEVSAVVPAAYGLASVVAFLMYQADKAAAQRGAWRTSESALHTIALVGGWPGALVARQAFRHKTAKQPFRTVFWVTVVANCAALAWFIHAAPVTLP